MDALTTLWLMSIVGAVCFTATGYFFARSRMSPAELPSSATREAAVEEAAPQPAKSEAPRAPLRSERLELNATPQAPDVQATPEVPEVQATPVAPEAAAAEPPVAATLPPVAVSPSMAPRRDARREDDDARSEGNEVDVLRVDSVRPRRGASVPPSTAANSELQRQLQALRVELRAEVLARDKVEIRATELADRLTAMSEPLRVLRAREAEWQSAARRAQSIIPGPASPEARTRLSSRAPGLFAEIDQLKADVARLTAENESLRGPTLGGAPMTARRPLGGTAPVVPEELKRMVDRVGRLENVHAAAVAEGSGLVLAGHGELADALAAFSAYMRDAASRSHRLLPLGATDEVRVRDASGLVFATQVLGPPKAELALVTLALGDVSNAAIRAIVAETPGLDADL